MPTTFSDFARAHARQTQNDGQGWYEACVTLDGKIRRRRSVRVCPVECKRVGESVRDGGDGRMGSDIRRWPQSLFDATLQRRSPTARLRLHEVFASVAPSESGAITHVRRVDDASCGVYRGMPTGIPLRWRVDPDRRHLQLQVARSLRSASQMRQHIVERGRNDLVDAVFPEGDGSDYPMRFARANDLSDDAAARLLTPRPTVYRVPVAKETSVAGGGWTTVRTLAVVEPGEAVDIDGHRLTWCTLGGTHPLQTCAFDAADDVQPVHRIRRDEEDLYVADHRTGRVAWRTRHDLRSPTSEDLRVHLIRLCAPREVETHSNVTRPAALEHSVAFVNGATVRHVRAASASGRPMATARITTGGWSGRPETGAVYVTDLGIRSGYPLTHASGRTLAFDVRGVDPEMQNDADAACVVQVDRTDRAAMLALLDGLLTTAQQSPRVLLAESDDPLWRAQLAGVLKMAPVHGDDPPCELAKCLHPDDSVCLSPDQRSLRVQGREHVLPILFGDSVWTMASPAFADADELDASKLNPSTLRDLLVLSDAERNAVDVQLRLDVSTGTLVCATGPTAWKNQTVLGFRRQRWINVARPVKLDVDVFASLPHPMHALTAAFMVETPEGDVGVVDNCKCRDPRALMLSEAPVYRCTGRTSSLLLRPFPSSHDLSSMRRFCESDASSALFRTRL